MKQFQYSYEKEFGLNVWLRRIQAYCSANAIPEEKILFRIYSDSTSVSTIGPVISRIRKKLPQALYTGSSTHGNIIHGGLAHSHIALSCTVFEDSSTRLKVLQLPLDSLTQEESASFLLKTVRENPWVRAVEMMSTVHSAAIDVFLERLSSLPDSVQFFGGGAHGTDTAGGDTSRAFVFSGSGAVTQHSAVFILYGGDSLHVQSRYFAGWQEMGRPMAITAAEGRVLKELNGIPARDVYKQYLGISEEKDFTNLAKVFPFSVESDSVHFLRVVVSLAEDGGLFLASPVKEGDLCRISYGNHGIIRECLQKELAQMREFRPQAIQLFSCAARESFWGKAMTSNETFPFETLAPTSGYYTSAEFLRTRSKIFLHNSTLVIVGMREGVGDPVLKDYFVPEESSSRHMMINRSLASFIQEQDKEHGW